MSFLDRLKREAEEQRLAAEAASREREERESTYRKEVEPRMLKLVEYLEGVVRTLIEIKPSFRAFMNIAGYGDLAAQPMWDYRFEHERRHRSLVLKLEWTWRVDPEKSPIVRAETAQKVRALIGAFRSHLLGGIKEELRNRAGDIVVATFHPRGQIRASFEAQISADDPVLRMVFTNASWLGTSRRQVPWIHIDDDLHDKLARFLVREDDTLFTEEFGARPRAPQVAAPVSVESMAPGDDDRTPAPREPAKVEAPTPPPAPVEEPSEPTTPPMDDVLEAIPDPTAALIAALGHAAEDHAPSALSVGAGTSSANPTTPAPQAMPVPPEVSMTATARAAGDASSTESPPTLAPAQPALAPASEDDLAPLTRTESALMEKLRRKAGHASQPSPGEAAGGGDGAPSENQTLDAAAFRRRMSGMLSKLRDDEPGGKSG